jgi:flagellar motor switch protein FliM
VRIFWRSIGGIEPEIKLSEMSLAKKSVNRPNKVSPISYMSVTRELFTRRIGGIVPTSQLLDRLLERKKVRKLVLVV